MKIERIADGKMKALFNVNHTGIVAQWSAFLYTKTLSM